jgi:hypothetical protein
MEPLLDLSEFWAQLHPVLLKQLAWMIAFFICAISGCYALFLAQVLQGKRSDRLGPRFADRPLTRRALAGLRRRGRAQLLGS